MNLIGDDIRKVTNRFSYMEPYANRSLNLEILPLVRKVIEYVAWIKMISHYSLVNLLHVSLFYEIFQSCSSISI